MINKEQMICPSCGSEDVEKIESECTEQLTLGPEFTFKEIIFRCHSCDMEGDFLDETKEYYLTAEKEAQNILVKQIIENLNNAGISMAFFERVFELPARTLTRWKSGDFSSATIALLRIVKTFPWIIEVAEHRFSNSFARYIMFKEIFNHLQREINITLSGIQVLNVASINIVATDYTYPIKPQMTVI